MSSAGGIVSFTEKIKLFARLGSYKYNTLFGTDMDVRNITFKIAFLGVCISLLPLLASCRGSHSQTLQETRQQEMRGEGHPGGPQLGRPGGGPSIDKSGDTVLQAMIREVVPKFRQLVYTDAGTGKTMKYNLFAPADIKPGRRYPLVLFMADASTPGESYTAPLTQGYGALVWATDEWQARNPCYVLVPQFAGVGVNDAYEHTDEVDRVIRLLDNVVENNPVDSNRLYTTGQSMGGMISMYYNIAYPDLFAASLFVDCHWDTSGFDELVRHKFVYVTAGTSGHSWGNIEPLVKAAEKEGRTYDFARWSARLPQAEQNLLAEAMLAKGASVNIINFTPRSVLPDDGKGSEHMYSFDYAYKLTPVLEWIFEQAK